MPLIQVWRPNQWQYIKTNQGLTQLVKSILSQVRVNSNKRKGDFE